MKTPKAKKLPSGAWFCRVRINGQDIPITRPTEKEAVAEAMAIKAGIKEASRQPGKDKTVSKAIDEYIEARQNILSPATIRGYRNIQKNMFQSVMHSKIGSITQSRWQNLVNLEARHYAAKTLKNAWGFMCTIIRTFTGKEYKITLPQIIPKAQPWLTPQQLNQFLDAIKGTNVEIAALLALSSLRRSELIALDWDKDIDLKKHMIYVSSATVPDEHHKMVKKKETKNITSRRAVPMIDPLYEALSAVNYQHGPVVLLSAYRVYTNINNICLDLGFPKVGVHGLRHSFASLALHRGIPPEEAMKIGGWADLNTMRKIYTHISETDKADYGAAFTSFFSKNGNENDNAT